MSEGMIEKVKQLETLFSKYEITGSELAQVRMLEEKLNKQEMTVSVIGQFKRGKSTLVNGILGEKVMPVGIVPVTAVVTTVKYGERGARVYFENGAVIDTSFEGISQYINEQENHDNHLGVSKVELFVPADFLKTGITLVDTPGVGSVHQKNTEAATAFVKESDAVIFLLSVDSPINSIETDFLEQTKAYASKFYFAVNKADVVDEEDLEDYMAYCRRLIAKLMDASDIHLFAVSAKKKIGLEALTEAVEKDCLQRAGEILEGSVKLKLRDVVGSALSQITLYRTALNMTGAEFEENGTMLQAQLNNFKNHLSDKVQELFGIEYHYDLPVVDLGATDASVEALDKIVFDHQVEELCRELSGTLNTIFMYREENAYTVVRRINDLNRLVRSLAKIRTELSE